MVKPRGHIAQFLLDARRSARLVGMSPVAILACVFYRHHITLPPSRDTLVPLTIPVLWPPALWALLAVTCGELEGVLDQTLCGRHLWLHLVVYAAHGLPTLLVLYPVREWLVTVLLEPIVEEHHIAVLLVDRPQLRARLAQVLLEPLAHRRRMLDRACRRALLKLRI
eukprot:7391677-Prymnesium_polylepis.1